jgi:integrase
MDELFLGYEAALRATGMAASTVLRNIHYGVMLENMHVMQGKEHLDYGIVADYTKSIRTRYESGEIGRKYCNSVMRNIGRFLGYVESGEVNLENPMRGSRYTLTKNFEVIADAFLASGKYHPNTRNDMRWVSHKYFVWLTAQGYADLKGVGAGQLQGFLVDSAKQLSPNSMHDVKLHLKKLYAYLYEAGLSESPYTEFLSFRVNRETRISPCLPQDDIARVLAAIDRSTIGGKRAYAAMLLGAELGLRACDVVELKLADIDWVSGEIKIVQAKTGRTLVLPLTTSLGEALRDYILNGRRNSPSQQIFVRLNTPHTPLKAAVTIGEIYRDCCIAAGIKSSTQFHDLRRSLGTAMAAGGVSVVDAAQVFGDAHIDSMKQYIALDSKHLKLCALPFDGIAPAGGGAQ